MSIFIIIYLKNTVTLSRWISLELKRYLGKLRAENLLKLISKFLIRHFRNNSWFCLWLQIDIVTCIYMYLITYWELCVSGFYWTASFSPLEVLQRRATHLHNHWTSRVTAPGIPIRSTLSPPAGPAGEKWAKLFHACFLSSFHCLASTFYQITDFSPILWPLQPTFFWLYCLSRVPKT